MAKNPLKMPEGMYEYISAISVRETPEQIALREETQKFNDSMMQISPDQGQFMAMLVKLTAAKNIIEVGTYTGYSALSMALALPDDGKLIACDISSERVDVGKPFWSKAGIADKIDLRIGAATDTLDRLIQDGGTSRYDMMFIDADKVNYDAYYEKGLELLRPNGLMLVDNVFWGGAVIDASDTSADTESIRSINHAISKDQRVDISMVSIGDGLFLVRKR